MARGNVAKCGFFFNKIVNEITVQNKYNLVECHKCLTLFATAVMVSSFKSSHYLILQSLLFMEELFYV